ncbi:hypothetical protein RclHR1_02520004 [Rhizophagus clarus]|uniref:Protein kinase domain-containing protein n=1 Tax=Rhizophagus clarus TaxID=94130 RepID=A0A2Z6RCN7_9GLOM|nr:hypothetical protein RclHR1_02520004 [Rhizophagus clarus]
MSSSTKENLEKVAENGEEEAMFELAFFYKKGEGTKRNLEKAFYWYQKAAENGNKKAMNNLAICYENGEGTERNLKKAFYWYQKAAENGNEKSINNLAICYENGEGTEKSLEKAFYWYQKATENGDDEAMFNLAICYENGEGTEKNLEKAFYWYQKAAENDNKVVMLNLATCYKNGEGIEKNLEKAFYWYQKAAENYDRKAMFNLAICYKNGNGTKKNLEKAFYWYQKAAENSNEEAILDLVDCYENGEGTEKNLKKTFYWHQKVEESNKGSFKDRVGICNECKQPHSDYQWCQQCNSKRFKQHFSKWTSKNEFIDKFIQEAQLNAKNSYEILEWIPYDKLSNINYYNKGGFSKIYKAIWLDGPVDSWDFDRQQWNRWNFQTGYEVVLKMLDNSFSLNSKFLDEWKYHYNCQKKSFSKLIRIFGITQDPNNLNYIIVMSYAKKGSLRKCLPHIIKFRWQDKLQLLKKIILGLKVIHESNLIHGDFHDGNILMSDDYNEAFIIDLGLCKPISVLQDYDKNNEIYGVLPYMAPEILKNKPYTSASDIYSLSMIMWEFTSDLMEKCWDPDPENRPAIAELEYKISEWIRCINLYYKMNKDGNHRFMVPNINNKLKNDMLDFIKANDFLVQEEANISVLQSHPQAYCISRNLTEISECLDYMI